MSKIFLREATGLVREANWFDILVFASLNISWGLSAWWYFLWGPYYGPGGDLLLGIALVLVPMIFGAVAWALLVTVVPRSGGDYVFNSRILHPLLGFLSSAGWILANFIWVAVLSAYVADPALSMTLYTVGLNGLADWVVSPAGIFFVGTIVILISSLVAILGLRAFRIFQGICFVLGVLMFLIVWAALLSAGHSGFISAWNTVSAQYGSANYDTLISDTFNYISNTYGVTPGYFPGNLASALPLIPVAAWGLLYPYLATYIAGETKRVERSMLIGMVGGLVFCGIAWCITAIILNNVVGYDFLLASSYAYGDGTGTWMLPYAPAYHVFAAILVPDILKWLIGIGFVAWNFYYALYSIMPQSRIALAWAFDRLAPSFFGDVSERFHTPVKGIIFFTIIGEIILAWYALYPGYLKSFTAVIPQILTTFTLTAIAAIILPYRKKLQKAYESSPVSKYKVVGVPLITICGIIYLLLLLSVLWYFFSNPGLGALHIPSLATLAATFAGSIVLYYATKWYRLKQGIDIDLAFRELPPE